MTKFNEAQLKYLENLIEFRGDNPEIGFNVKGDVAGYVDGNVRGDVRGCVFGDVVGSVRGDIWGNVRVDLGDGDAPQHRQAWRQGLQRD